MAVATGRIVRVATGILVLSIGLALAAGGGVLASLGGSLYYLFSGLALTASGVLLLLRHGAAIWLYFGVLLGTLLWAIAEVGFAPWPLVPRLVAPAILALVFFFPVFSVAPARMAKATGALGVAVLVLIAGTFVMADSHEISSSKPIAGRSMATNGGPGDQWLSWGGDAGGRRFSELTAITPSNVDNLEPAWTFRTGIGSDVNGYLSATPLMANGRLYLCTQTNEVIALDPESGTALWRFDPDVADAGASAVRTCRGVAFKKIGGEGACSSRIFTATFDGRLIALDANDGLPCRFFGDNGEVNLLAGMGTVLPGFYYVSAPPTIANGQVIVGGWVADNQSTDEPSGVIRAFDQNDGTLSWAWDAGNPENGRGAADGSHYTRSTPNSWAPMSADEDLGMVYVPTGNPTPDHYGAQRSEASRRYGSSVVALDTATGDVRWSFQTTHHDLWDYDVPAQPSLFATPSEGGKVPAIAIPTKRGEIFVLDRRTGRPLADVTERPAPQRGAVEAVAATQPYSAFPSMAGPDLVESDMWGLTPLDQLWCRVRFRELRYDGKVTPPGIDEALIYPSIGGGMNFGGVAIDPDLQLMVVNALFYGTIVQLVPREETDRLLTEVSAGSHSATAYNLPLPQAGTPYGVRLSPLASPLNVPCNAPPYGRLAAIDLTTGKVLWKRPFGTAQDSGPFGISLGLPISMGAPNFGGALTTASGLTFIGAVREKALRAYDTATGEELWRTRLPASAQTLPMTYSGPRSGRQFIVVSAGGHRMLQSPVSDTVVAYALKNNE